MENYEILVVVFKFFGDILSDIMIYFCKVFGMWLVISLEVKG